MAGAQSQETVGPLPISILSQYTDMQEFIITESKNVTVKHGEYIPLL